MLILTSLCMIGTVLGVDRDTSFSFHVIAVHNAVHDLLIRPEHVALVEERIHQRGLAGVDVGNDGNIDDFFFWLMCILLSICKRNEISFRSIFIDYCAKFVEILTIARKN